MPNYKESTIQGTQYTRCRAVEVLNNYGKVPQVNFQEEQISLFGDEVIRKGLGSINIPYNGSKTITLVNPVDNTPLGKTVTYEEMYVMLYSAYIQEALARDASVSN